MASVFGLAAQRCGTCVFDLFFGVFVFVVDSKRTKNENQRSISLVLHFFLSFSTLYFSIFERGGDIDFKVGRGCDFERGE